MTEKFRQLLLLLTVALLTACTAGRHTAGALPPAHASDGAQQDMVLSSASAPHHHEATLSDVTHLYRLCSSRPQRLLPTHGSKPGRSVTAVWGWNRRRNVKPSNSHTTADLRSETAPFCLSASRHYYVIALRHILC